MEEEGEMVELMEEVADSGCCGKKAEVGMVMMMLGRAPTEGSCGLVQRL